MPPTEPPARPSHFRLLVALSLSGAAPFALLAASVVASESVAHVDESVAAALHRHAEASPGWVTFFRVVTWFGTAPALILLSAVAIVLLARAGRPRLALAWLITLLGSIPVIVVTKNTFDRPRPVWEEPLAVERSYSFPSGHAVGSTVGYGMAAYCLALRWRTRRRRLAIAVVVAAWALLIGFSRIYLGVHYVSD